MFLCLLTLSAHAQNDSIFKKILDTWKLISRFDVDARAVFFSRFNVLKAPTLVIAFLYVNCRQILNTLHKPFGMPGALRPTIAKETCCPVLGSNGPAAPPIAMKVQLWRPLRMKMRNSRAEATEVEDANALCY